MKSLASIAATGAFTPLGLNSLQTAFSHRAAANAITEAPLCNQDGEPITMSYIQTLDERLLGQDRLLALAMPAVFEILDGLGEISNALKISLTLCLGEELSEKSERGIPISQEIAHALESRLRSSTAEITINAITRGPAGPGIALPDICQTLSKGQIDAALVLGVHSDYHPHRIATLEREGRLFSPKNPYAVLPGEASAAVLFMRPDTIRRFRLRELAELWAVTTGTEKTRHDNDEPAFLATATTAALRNLLAPLHAEGSRVGWFLSDLGFEPYRFHELQSAMTRLHPFFCEPQALENPAQRIGNLGAAALPLHIALASEAYCRGYAPHAFCTCIAGNDSGERAFLLLAQPHD